VVQAYNKYKNKNFTILGVSLDKEKEDWLGAIETDKLSWTQVSDLQEWNSTAVSTFNFSGIPFNVLVDPEGKIIAQSLRGDSLGEKLEGILK
jgi:alkyl hydroperoxide reductase subunit AhpC